MDEAEFWTSLEYRLSREFAGLPERRYQYFWCDGFIPGEYLLDGPSPRIIGHCWICNGDAQASWEFALLLPGPVTSRETVDWASLHPAEHVTGWLSFDEARQHLEMEPAVAIPNLVELGAKPIPDV